MKISILCPTRKRPDNIHNLVWSAFDNCKERYNLEFVFYVDKDDRQSELKIKSFQNQAFVFNIKYIIGERIVLSQMWNECLKIATGEIFMQCGDDIVFKTQNWDEKVREAFYKFNDRIVLVHGSDGNEGLGADPNFGTHCFVHRNWISTLGYFFPPIFASDYTDTWLNFLANELNRRVKIDILTDHLHFAYGRGIRDKTHDERIERHHKDNCDLLYLNSLPKRLQDVEKLRKFIEDYETTNSNSIITI